MRPSMLRRTPSLDAFERDCIASAPPDHARALVLFEALWAEAVELGVLPSKDPLEGIDIDIRLVRALNVLRAPRADR